MRLQIIYTSRSASVVYLFQGMAILFLIAGMGLAWKLTGAPVTSATAHSTHNNWAVVLAALAVITPIFAWFYGRRIVASIAVSHDGRFVFIKSASLMTPSAKRWPVEAIKIHDSKTGDIDGEAEFGLPRVMLALDDGRQQRKYLLSCESKDQLDILKHALR